MSGIGRRQTIAAVTLVVALLAGPASLAAADQIDELGAAAPPGVEISELVRHEIAWMPPPIGGSATDWAFFQTFERYLIEPGAAEVVEMGAGGPGAASFYVEDGPLVFAGGIDGTYAGGEAATLPRSEVHNPPTTVAIRNPGDACAVALRLTTGSCYQCGGGPMSNPLPPPLTGGRCAPPLEMLPLIGFVPAPVTAHFLLRVTIEPGAEWDFGDRLGQLGIVVERGTLTLVDPRGGQDRKRTGESLEVRPTDPHLAQNLDPAPLTFLVFGVVPARFAGSSVLEIHRATCPLGARTPYYQDCHHLGQPFVPFELEGPGGYVGRERTETTISEMVPEPGPGVAIFRGLRAGRYRLTEPRWQEDDPRVYVFCADRTQGPFVDGPTLAEFRGPASAGVDLDIPEGTHVVCDWYAGV